MVEDWQQGGFGLYVHWPFCASKCPYCDFNSHVVSDIDESRWISAYLAEIERAARLVPDRTLQSIYFGGGTPSLMYVSTVERILDKAMDVWTPSNNIEITLEANPTSVEIDKFIGFRSAGVNRVSLGIQALNDHDLRRLGRMHSAKEGVQAIDIANNIFDRVSFDLIYARQDQTIADWESELNLALSMAADHISAYQLTIEDGTVFGERYAKGQLLGLPAEDLQVDMFDVTQNLCKDAGFFAYEVSNHAKPGSESRHNLIYWSGGDYVGIGPGAHGRLTMNGKRYATEAWSQPNKWLEAVSNGTGDKLTDQLTGIEHAEEYLMMGLRVQTGIDLQRFQSLSGTLPDEHKLSDLIQFGLLERTGTILKATPEGRLVLNSILRELLSG